MEQLLELTNLQYSYTGHEETLRVKYFAVGKGEKIAVLGANGAGKSTLFLCMNGVLSPKGEIVYRGTKIDRKNLNLLRKNVGIVFQDSDRQIIASTVSAEVSFGPMNLKLPREEVARRVEQSLGYMNITAMADRPPHYLSGGEKKRVAIADILAMEPEIIIFDEPTASLDPMSTEMLETVLTNLHQEGKTLLISTHDVDFAYRWADRTIVVNGGDMIADDSTLRVFQNKEVLHRSNLKTPILMEVYEMLVHTGRLPDEGAYPRTTTELEALLSK